MLFTQCLSRALNIIPQTDVSLRTNTHDRWTKPETQNGLHSTWEHFTTSNTKGSWKKKIYRPITEKDKNGLLFARDIITKSLEGRKFHLLFHLQSPRRVFLVLEPLNITGTRYCKRFHGRITRSRQIWWLNAPNVCVLGRQSSDSYILASSSTKLRPPNRKRFTLLPT